ncbi:hypothetical protein D3C75_522260 [compost metagenome]
MQNINGIRNYSQIVFIAQKLQKLKGGRAGIHHQRISIVNQIQRFKRNIAFHIGVQRIARHKGQILIGMPVQHRPAVSPA